MGAGWRVSRGPWRRLYIGFAGPAHDEPERVWRQVHGGSARGLETNILLLQALHMMNRSVCGGGFMVGQHGALETNILVLQALHMMKWSVCGGRSAGQPGALETTYIGVAGPAHDEPERVWRQVHGGSARGSGD